MKNMKKLLAVLLALTMLAGLLAACGGNETPDAPDASENNEDPTQGGEVSAEGPQYGGHLNVRTAARPTGLDPCKQTGTWRYIYTTCVYEPALTRDADNEIRPSVCDFELSEDLLDLKLWVREGYTFSNGDAVDIHDVKASYERGLNMYANMTRYVKPFIASMEVENDGEKDILHIVFSEYREKCLHYMASYQTWCPVMPKEICEKYASSYIIDEIEDAIGTGPYVFADFKDSEHVTLQKRSDYNEIESEYSGAAGTKHGYMDSMTFYYNGNDSSAGMALLSGDYDMTEVLPSEYADMAQAQGLVCTVLDSDQRTWIIFNTRGTNNLCAKYPSLRKAVMAAIDYNAFLEVITDGAQILEGENANIVLGDAYNTDAFSSQDYYGPSNAETVEKYLAEAREQGYAGEPLQLVYNNSRDDIPLLLCDALDMYGINYQKTTMESTVYTSFVSDPANNWDFYFSWNATAFRPSLMGDAILQTDFDSAEKDAILDEMYKLDPASAEYQAKWQELATLMAEGCYIGYMSAIDWWWWHPDTLHIDNDGYARFMYNIYWEDPANHPMG